VNKAKSDPLSADDWGGKQLSFRSIGASASALAPQVSARHAEQFPSVTAIDRPHWRERARLLYAASNNCHEKYAVKARFRVCCLYVVK
jgi:hypothetical protein